MTILSGFKKLFSGLRVNIDKKRITDYVGLESKKRKWFPRMAFKEAQELVKKYKIPEIVGPFGEETIEVWEGRKVILHVPIKIFEKLFKDLKPEYAYEHVRPNDPDAGYGPRRVWFVTKNRVRVQADDMQPHGSDFYDKVFHPSYVAQFSKVVEFFGGKETTEEEISRLERRLGFEVEDSIVNEFNSDPVSRVKLLSKEEIRKFERDSRKRSSLLIVVEKKPTKK